MDNYIIFIAYFLHQSGVESLRSRALLRCLKEEGIRCVEVHQQSFGELAKANRYIWLLRCVFYLIRKNSVIYVSCGPFWLLLALLFVKMFCHHRIIIDFRDPWSLNIKTGYGTGCCSSTYKLAMAECLEKKIYKYCSLFVVCTPGMMVGYTKLFGDQKKILCVPNGHDLTEEFLKNIARLKIEHDFFRIVCIGKFASYSVYARQIVESLKKKLKEEKLEYKIEFIGTDQKTRCLFKDDEKVIFYPRKNYEETIRHIVGADMGLCVQRNENFEFGTKVFDYIGLGIPVYDCFQKNSSFKNYFKEYLQKNIKKNEEKNGMDLQGKFLRKNQFKQLILLIKEEMK